MNTPYLLTDARRWQPDMVGNGYGIRSAQKFITPQLKYAHRAYLQRTLMPANSMLLTSLQGSCVGNFV